MLCLGNYYSGIQMQPSILLWRGEGERVVRRGEREGEERGRGEREEGREVEARGGRGERGAEIKSR